MGYAIYECTASDIGSRSREGAARFIVSFDIIVVIVFLLAIWTLQYFVRIDFDQDKDQTFEISQFAVEFTNLPALGEEYTKEMLSADLIAHISERIIDSDQIIGKLEDEHPRKNCEIVSIQVVTNDFNALDHIMDIQTSLQDMQKIDIQIDQMRIKGGHRLKIRSFEDRKEVLEQVINERRIEYYETMVEDEDPAACAAFVTFRSQEGMQRAMETYYIPLYKRIAYSLFPCCFSESFKELMFNEKFLHVKRPIEPSLINWNHHGVPSWERFLRQITLWFLLLGIIVFTFLMTMYINKSFYTNMEKVPDFFCNKSIISEKNATADYMHELHQRNGDHHCFCNSMFETEGSEYTRDFSSDDTDGVQICESWI